MKRITKTEFVAVLESAGVTDDQKRKLHATFESRHPEEHEDFLRYLGLEPAAIAEIRRQSRQH